ncbi:MAG: hypothetical protein JNJ61_08675 [Anaerolineae bacterium]|nr:hypothetical protein [Anaerolineae bacterium]
MSLITVNLLVESPLDESVLRRLVQMKPGMEVGISRRAGGKTTLEKFVGSVNQAAALTPYACLVDLDSEACAPGLIKRLLPQGCHSNLCFRVAVREVEAWLLADRANLAVFMGVALNKIDPYPDANPDPKALIIRLARLSKIKRIRQDIVPPPENKTAKVGKAYNDVLIEFVIKKWDIAAAVQNSPSLERAVRALQAWQPQV